MRVRLVWAALRQKGMALLAYCAAGLGMLWLYTALYPSLQAQSRSYDQIVKALPPAVMKVFGAYGVGLDSLAGLLATKQFGLVWPLLLVLLMISIAGSSIAAEIERLTLGLWLSAPVSRRRIYWSKYSAGVIALVLFVASTVLTAVPLAYLYNIALDATHLYWVALIGFLFGLAVFSIAILLSTLANSRGLVYGVTGMLLLLMFVLNAIASLVDNLSSLRYFSFFYYFNATNLLTSGGVNYWSVLVFGGIAFICAWAAAIIFSRRDLAV